MAVTSLGTEFAAVQPEDQLRPWDESRRTLRLRQRRSASWPALLGLVAVVTIGVVTGLWLGPRLDANLSGVSTLPTALGFVQMNPAPHPAVGYVTAISEDERRDRNANR